ncbi:MAG TPA: hypothetical protein VLA34_11055 [Candidatus Krumholzibacterium sp.]|nr:hypothetical protein [Candidatus Krumholzibacterium sp.]
MRYFRLVPLFLIVFVLAAPALAEVSGPGYSAEFEKFAAGQSKGLDSEWNKVVGKASGGTARTMSAVFDGPSDHFGRSRSRSSGTGLRLRYRNRSTSDWAGSIDGSGFIHSGISGQFLPNVTRTRSDASRGLGMPDSPAGARLKGTWREPFNASGFTRSGRLGSSAAARKSPRMGTRLSVTSRGTRSGGFSSFGTLGSSRTRRRR